MPFRLENLLKTYLHLENYPVRIADMLRLIPEREVEYRLRQGPNYLVRTRTSDGSCVVDVTRENEYFKFFGILPGDYVIDIGANIGSFSVYAAWLQPTAKVIAVEPLEANFSLLKRNGERNGLKNLEPMRFAVMEKEGEVKIYHGEGNAEASSSMMKSTAKVDESKVETVPGIPFAKLLEKVPRVDFLKIDCEGAEFDFIPSADLSKVRKLAMEYHDFRSDMDHTHLVKKLEKHGFRVFQESHGGTTRTGMIYAVAQ